MLASCQKDELFEKGNLPSSPKLEVSRISFEEVPHKNEAAALIEKIHKKKNNSLLEGKGIYDSINKFTVHTDEIVLITSETTHWLNFYISREPPGDKLENLALVWDPVHKGYVPFLVKYNLTKQDSLDLQSGNPIKDLATKTNIGFLEGRVNKCEGWVHVFIINDYGEIIDDGWYWSDEIPCGSDTWSWPDSFFPWVTDVVDGNDYNGDGNPNFNGIELSDDGNYNGGVPGNPPNGPPCTHCPPPIIAMPILPEEEEEEEPCPGDPVKNPEIAPQHGSSGAKGALFGCTRYGDNECVGEDGRNKKHNGIDIKNEYGDPVYAMYDGIASKHEFSNAGNIVYIQSVVNGETISIQYFHLQDDGRSVGQVMAGDIIGYQGDSGNLKRAIASGGVESHVHIKIKDANNNAVDPRDYMATEFDNNGSVTNNCE